MENTLEKIREIKKQYEGKWLSQGVVCGVGIGKTSFGESGIIISLKEYDSTILSKIPDVIDGVPVEIKVVGNIQAL